MYVLRAWVDSAHRVFMRLTSGTKRLCIWLNQSLVTIPRPQAWDTPTGSPQSSGPRSHVATPFSSSRGGMGANKVTTAWCWDSRPWAAAPNWQDTGRQNPNQGRLGVTQERPPRALGHKACALAYPGHTTPLPCQAFMACTALAPGALPRPPTISPSGINPRKLGLPLLELLLYLQSLQERMTGE